MNRGLAVAATLSGAALITGVAVAARRPTRLGASVTTLPKLSEETWDDGTHVVRRRSPFPFRRKPFVPSRLVGAVRMVPLRLVYGTQSDVVEYGVQKYMRGQHDLPLVYAEHDGTFTIGDGHHRLVAAFLRGRKMARARVVQVP